MVVAPKVWIDIDVFDWVVVPPKRVEVTNRSYLVPRLRRDDNDGEAMIQLVRHCERSALDRRNNPL